MWALLSVVEVACKRCGEAWDECEQVVDDGGLEWKEVRQIPAVQEAAPAVDKDVAVSARGMVDRAILATPRPSRGH